MKSQKCDEILARSDEICFADEIKSVLNFRRSRISSQSDFIRRRWIYPVRKDGFNRKETPFVRRAKGVSFLEQGTGIEPASEAWEASVLPMN